MGNSGQQGSGLAPNIAGMLCYIFAPVSSLIFLLLEKEDKEVQFHAWQGTLMGATLIGAHIIFVILRFILGTIAGFFTVLFSFFLSLLWLGVMVLAVVCMIKAYKGERWALPVLGEIAASKVGL